MNAAPRIRVEVVYALPERQDYVELDLPAGTTVCGALDASRLAERHPEIDLAQVQIGVYGKLVARDHVLRDHDRVEVYRPLIADPKEVRRQRAAQAKAAKQARGARPVR